MTTHSYSTVYGGEKWCDTHDSAFPCPVGNTGAALSYSPGPARPHRNVGKADTPRESVHAYVQVKHGPCPFCVGCAVCGRPDSNPIHRGAR